MGNLVAIVGRPNVGKSTLFNRLTETRTAIVSDIAGTTRDRQYGHVIWGGREFSLVDTGGWVINSEDIFEDEINKQVEIAIEEADVILCEGIGNTIRVSLTADPVKEVAAGIAILKAAGLRKGGVRFVSCPTCGRTEIDLISLANEVEKRVSSLNRDITVAVMGCVVNGPGEAREADYGIAGGVDKGLIFKKGVVVGTYPYARLPDVLLDMINSDE